MFLPGNLTDTCSDELSHDPHRLFEVDGMTFFGCVLPIPQGKSDDYAATVFGLPRAVRILASSRPIR
jgi:hypothetical protein